MQNDAVLLLLLMNYMIMLYRTQWQLRYNLTDLIIMIYTGTSVHDHGNVVNTAQTITDLAFLGVCIDPLQGPEVRR